MKPIGVRINESGKEPELENYILGKLRAGDVKTKTDAFKLALHQAIKYENEYLPLQEELKKKDQQIELLYEIISKLKGQPIETNIQPKQQNDDINLDVDFGGDDLISITEDISDDNLDKEFLRKFG